MDQCSAARYPSSHVTVLADHQGHDLTLGLVVLSLEVLTRWPGSVTSLMSQAVRVPLVSSADRPMLPTSDGSRGVAGTGGEHSAGHSEGLAASGSDRFGLVRCALAVVRIFLVVLGVDRVEAHDLGLRLERLRCGLGGVVLLAAA
jgi:hypothetical protein